MLMTSPSGSSRISSSLYGSSCEQLQRLVARDLLAHERRVPALTILRHLRLDLLEVLGRERLPYVEVVVEPVLDRRTDGDLTPGKEVLHRVRHHVRRAVSQR